MPDYGSGVGVPVNGTLVLLLIDNQLVGHQRGMTVAETNATVDYSSKEQRERRLGYGRYESTVSVQSLYVPNASGYAAIQAASRAGTLVELIRREVGADFESAMAKIDSVSGDFPDQGEAVLSVDFSVDGAWEPVTP
jgi:hypothetical protein